MCGYAEIELAHEQMRRHRGCRIHACAWKAAAYQTLVRAGRLAPQSTTPRQRAAQRAISFPALPAEPPTDSAPTPQTLRDVLDRLSDLALPNHEPSRTPRHSP
ncbi:hypothetical protein [Nocardia spumae]|uniref:hypothetical protein n=1 Tax=Nocardia spumae TaxID=2887190 RepID=UPI001D1435FD|nr:hypothetical protein [Nocardia spumae]